MSERPRLSRRVDGRLITGVAGGIADWLSVSATLVRVVLWFAAGFLSWIIAAYAVAALVIPARGRQLPDWDNLLAVGRLGLVFAVPRLVLGEDLGVNELFDESPELWVPAGGLVLVGAAVLFTSNLPRGPSAAESRARVLGALPLVCFAAVIGLGVWLVPDVRWDAFIPVGAILAGLILAEGVHRGRWRVLVAPAVLATAAAAAVAGADLRLEGGVGDRVVRATAAGGLPPTQRVAVGDLGADLSRVRLGSRPVTFRASVGVGDLTVVVPRDAQVSLDARVGLGEMTFADYQRGFDLRLRAADARLRAPLRTSSRPLRVHLIAEVGVGTFDIERAGTGGGL